MLQHCHVWHDRATLKHYIKKNPKPFTYQYKRQC